MLCTNFNSIIKICYVNFNNIIESNIIWTKDNDNGDSDDSGYHGKLVVLCQMKMQLTRRTWESIKKGDALGHYITLKMTMLDFACRKNMVSFPFSRVVFFHIEALWMHSHISIEMKELKVRISCWSHPVYVSLIIIVIFHSNGFSVRKLVN